MTAIQKTQDIHAAPPTRFLSAVRTHFDALSASRSVGARTSPHACCLLQFCSFVGMQWFYAFICHGLAVSELAHIHRWILGQPYFISASPNIVYILLSLDHLVVPSLKSEPSNSWQGLFVAAIALSRLIVVSARL